MPSETTHPDMTAIWEAKLNEISHRVLQYSAFMEALIHTITELLYSTEAIDASQFAGLKSKNLGAKNVFIRSKIKPRNKGICYVFASIK